MEIRSAVRSEPTAVGQRRSGVESNAQFKVLRLLGTKAILGKELGSHCHQQNLIDLHFWDSPQPSPCSPSETHHPARPLVRKAAYVHVIPDQHLLLQQDM